MDISKLSPQHDINAPESLDDELEIDLDKDELSEDLKSNEKKNKEKINQRTKKHRHTDSRTLTAFYENHDTQSLLRSSSDKSEKSHLDKIKEKVKQGFNKELSTFIAESKQPKAATLLQKNTKSTATTSHDETILEESKESALANETKNKQSIKEKAKQAFILKHPDLHTPLKNYIALFGENQLKDSPEKKEKLNHIKQSLQAKGVSQKQLSGIEKGVQTLINNDLKRLLKHKFTDLAFSFEKKPTSDLLNNYSKYYSVLDFAKQAHLFDANPEGLNQLKEDVKRDISHFITNELDRSVVETKLKSNSNSDLIKAFDQFNNLTSFTKFDPSSYLKTFHKKLENEGLTAFLPPEDPGYLDTQNHNQSNQHQNKKDSPSQTPEDLEQSLLNLEIKSLLSHNLIDSIKTKLNLMMLKRQCKQHNIHTKTIQKQAHAIASLRAKMECRTLFELRATLPHLNGPEYQEFQKKLKPLLKTLKKLNNPMNSNDLRLLRDQSNKAMFSIIKEDYIKTSVFLETNPKNSTLLSQKKHFLSILKRIQSETPINETISPKMLDDLQFLEDVNINEAA
ncbi:hypothetical protein CL658_05085 [bacterium]|nr:hypothetical protein [bacterium]